MDGIFINEDHMQDFPQEGFFMVGYHRTWIRIAVFAPCLVANFKIPKLSHRREILHAWSIKSKQNKKLIIQFACKLRDQSNEPN